MSETVQRQEIILAKFTEKELLDIHRALKSQENIYQELGWEKDGNYYNALAARILRMVRRNKGKDHIGERSISREGVGVEIIEWLTKDNITVRFDNGRVFHQAEYRKFKKGLLYAMPKKQETET